MEDMIKEKLAGIIDHTLLKPDATLDQIENLCMEAKQYEFASVCIQPYYVAAASKLLDDSDVKVCTVIGFPLGANTADVKAFEAKKAVEDGAEEVDMVINIGALKSKEYQLVKEDIQGVVEAVGSSICVKVILETCLLTDEEKKIACQLSKEAGADFVKTSTGFSTGGATKEDVKLMFDAVSPDLKVKASGGIRSTHDALTMVAAGASRIGASSSIKIVEEF